MGAEPDSVPPEPIDFNKPSPARVWNYWLGGRDNYEIDRVVGDEAARVNPNIPLLALQCRRFLVRAVTYLAGEVGIRQFLDIGTGLPTENNTHEVAQRVAPASKIVYVDNDPLVLAHARALLTNTTNEGITTYIHADVCEPDALLADARNVLNFHEPVAVMLLGILGHAAHEFDLFRSIITTLMTPMPSGSYLVLLDGAETGDEVYRSSVRRLKEMEHSYQVRTIGQFQEVLAGLRPVSPGLVPCNRWRPDAIEVGINEPCNAHGVVALKP